MLSLDDLAAEYEDLQGLAEAEELEEGDADRMNAIHALAEELGFADIAEAARSADTLIAEDDFEDYIRDSAEGMFDVDMNSWPFSCIDWSRAAEEAQHDYTAIEFDDTTYYTRG
jgi:hypothetical protein